METKQQEQFIETGLKTHQIDHLDREHDDQIPYSFENQIDHLTENIKFYVTLLLQEDAPTAQIQSFKSKIIQQINILYSEQVHTHKLEDLNSQLSQKINMESISEWPGYKKIQEFGRVLKQLMAIRSDTENQEDFVQTSRIIQGFLKEMQVIVQQDSYTVSRLENYDPYINNIDKSCDSNDRSVIQLQPNHYWKQQKIIFHSEMPPQVFTWVQPPLHRVYLSQVTKVYHEIVPFKIKFISLSSLDQPKIQTQNYFKEDLQTEKAVIMYCKPGTNIMYSYQLSDICKLLTIQKQYLNQKQLPINWKFSKYSKTLITPQGRVFAINCKATSTRIDSSMYQITQEKVSNLGRRPQPKYDSGFVYANKALYVIGGNNNSQTCSKKNYKYSFRDKKWKQIADSNVALRKPSVCTFRNRYIMKIGGINQFDYINKVIEIYDTQTDKWSIVRASPKNVLEQIEILQDSIAVQINQDQIYVFSGKNSNNFQKDTGFVLEIMELRQKPGKPLKVASQLWNVTIGKKNIYSFFGLFSQSNVIVHNNCLYAMRVTACKSLPN